MNTYRVTVVVNRGCCSCVFHSASDAARYARSFVGRREVRRVEVQDATRRRFLWLGAGEKR